MTDPQHHATRGRRQARIMRLVNVPMRWLLRLPFATPAGSHLVFRSFVVALCVSS
jgi:hypothetical protein